MLIMATIQQMLNNVGKNPNVCDVFLGQDIAGEVFDDIYRVIGIEPPYFIVTNSDTTSITYKINGNPREVSVEANVPTKVKVEEELTSMYEMFVIGSKITSLDISHLDTSKVTIMFSTFYGDRELVSIKGLDKWDTSQVTNMSNIFRNCFSLTSLDLSNWDTSKVTNMYCMFDSCTSLTSLDLSNWDTSKVTSMAFMFNECSKLTHIKCTQAFKDWCIANQSVLYLPTAMREGGSGTWEIVA